MYGTTTAQTSYEKTCYLVKNVLIYVFLVADILLNTIVDMVNHRQRSLTVYILIGSHLILRLTLMFMVVLLMWDTFIFKYGLLNVLCRQFRWLFITAPLSFIFFLAVRGMKLTATIGSKTFLELWEDDGYYAVYILNIIASAFYYMAHLHTCFLLGQPDFYKPSGWDRINT